MSSRLIIVSNRLPFKLAEKKGQIDFFPSSGGLVSSIRSYIQKTNPVESKKEEDFPLWVGASDISEKKSKKLIGSETYKKDEFILTPVFIPSATKDKFYNGFCNDTIWPLFHYFPSYAKFKDDFYESYLTVNNLFCEKLVSVYKPGDIIWIHDYHLMLLPALLRKYLPEASIGFFLHIPFPSFELFRLLPNRWRREILSGMLGADLIGFHTNDYVQYFLKSVRQILGYENTLRTIVTSERSVTVDTFPVSIDFAKFHTATKDPDVFTERNKIKKKLFDVKVVISVDRLDYSKGIINRLEGFELFFEKYPEYRGKAAYILIIVPSRDIIPKYTENRSHIEGLVSRINGKYGNIDWTPIVYQYRSLDFKKLTGLYLAADVALIAPVRDGMNLVAKEFVATRNDKRGVLILSETAGAAAELGEALIVNPTDRQEIADALKTAFNMPIQEQNSRNDIMQKRIGNYDVIKWADDFISQLILSKTKQEKLKVKEVTGQIENQITMHYSSAESRLILLDYDGTLTPLARLPHLAFPGDELINLLKSLAKDEKNEIVIISGRPMEVLKEWFEQMPLSLVAEHGAFYKQREVDWQQTVPLNAGWKPSVIPLLNLFTERCAGTFIEEKTLSLAWHYRNAEKELGFLRSRELINALVELSSHLDFQIIEGNKVIETRARGIDKGIAASIWLKHKQYDFVLAIGDDKTDEDLFNVIPSSQYSIRVGLMQSAARYNFKQQKEVLSFLKKLSKNQLVEI